MVNLVKLINIGRKLGCENVAQLRNIGKSVQKAVEKKTLPAALNGHFEYTTKQLAEMSDGAITELGKYVPEKAAKKLTEIQAYQQRMMKLNCRYAPKACADDTKHIMDIDFKRIGQESGIVEMNLNNSTNSVLCKGKILFNKAGVRIKHTSVSEVGSSKSDFVFLRNDKVKNPAELYKKLEIQSTGNVTSITLPKTNLGRCIAEMDMKIDKDYADRLANLASKGHFFDVTELVKFLTKQKRIYNL